LIPIKKCKSGKDNYVPVLTESQKFINRNNMKYPTFFEEIETIQSSVKANVKSIQKLRKRINSLRGSRSFKPAYSH